MRQALRATLITGSGSLLTMVAGLASAKALALMLGPEGVGLNGLLYSLFTLVSMVCGLGLNATLVRLGAPSAAMRDQLSLTALYHAAWRLYALVAGLGLAGLWAGREVIAIAMLGGAAQAGSVLIVGVSAMLTLGALLQAGLVNAFHRVAALTRLNVLQGLIAATATIVIVGLCGAQGLPWAILAGSGVHFAAARLMLVRQIGTRHARPSEHEVRQAMGALLRLGVPMMVSMVVGSGVMQVLPLLVLHQAGCAGVGVYRAVSTIVERNVGLLTTAFTFDFAPRIAALKHPAAINAAINQQLRLVLLMSVPAVLGLIAASPWLLPLLYSDAFGSGTALLEWTLISCLFKLPCWALGMAVMHQCRAGLYFGLETASGLATLAVGWAGLAAFGLLGLGLALTLTSAGYFVAASLVLARRFGFRPDGGNQALLLAGVGAALALEALPACGLGAHKGAAAAVLAALATAGCALRLRRESRRPAPLSA